MNIHTTRLAATLLCAPHDTTTPLIAAPRLAPHRVASRRLAPYRIATRRCAVPRCAPRRYASQLIVHVRRHTSMITAVNASTLPSYGKYGPIACMAVDYLSKSDGSPLSFQEISHALNEAYSTNTTLKAIKGNQQGIKNCLLYYCGQNWVVRNGCLKRLSDNETVDHGTNDLGLISRKAKRSRKSLANCNLHALSQGKRLEAVATQVVLHNIEQRAMKDAVESVKTIASAAGDTEHQIKALLERLG